MISRAAANSLVRASPFSGSCLVGLAMPQHTVRSVFSQYWQLITVALKVLAGRDRPVRFLPPAVSSPRSLSVQSPISSAEHCKSAPRSPFESHPQIIGTPMADKSARPGKADFSIDDFLGEIEKAEDI